MTAPATIGYCAVMITTGDRIRIARKQRGLTQGALASLVGVNRATVTKWETGKTAPRVSEVNLLGVHLGVKPWWIAYGIGE